MKYFCLNIEGATDRRTHCENEFAKAGIDVQFVSAFDTHHNRVRHLNPHYKVGHLGCYLSHLRMIEEIRRYDYAPAMIFEDDIWLTEDFKNKLAVAIEALPEEWEVAFVGWWPAYFDHSKLNKLPVNDHWMSVNAGELWGFHCYMVNGKRGGDRMMNILQPIRKHVDVELLDAVVRGEVRGYFLQEPLANQTGTFKSQTNAW